MASLEELLQSGLGGIIQGGGAPLEEDLYQRQAQSERESTFGRGLGISTVTRDALAKARVDASLAAEQAQLAALGQAASYTNANNNRIQQESQFSRGLKQQKDAANTQLIAGGVGAGVGALGQLGGAAFGPEIRTGTRGMFGFKPLPQDTPRTPTGEPGGTMPSAAPGVMPQFDAGNGGGGFDLSNLGGDFSMPSTSFGSGDFSATDFGDFGGLDLSSLYDMSFGGGYDPYQWGYM